MSWDSAAAIANLYTLQDISNIESSSSSPASPTDPASNSKNTRNTLPSTPISRLSAQSRAKGYDTLCVPLTTAKWKDRWSKMCLVSPEPAHNASDSWKRESQWKRESRRDSRWFKGSIADTGRDLALEKTAEEWRRRPVFEKDEVTMTTLEEAESVVAIVSEWLELDADDDWVRHDTEIALQQELSYAAYLNIGSVILPPPHVCNRAHIASYARIVNSVLENTPYVQISIRLPIYDAEGFGKDAAKSSPGLSTSSSVPSGFIFSNGSISSASLSGSPSRSPSPFPRSSTMSPPWTPTLVVSPSKDDGLGPGMARKSSISLNELAAAATTPSGADEFDAMWEMWDVIRSICGYNTRLSLALDLTPPLPTPLSVLGKWAAEAVKYIVIPSSTFIANSKGYPVLPKPTQKFIRDSMTHRPTVILSGASAGLHANGGEPAYSQYVRHLERTSPAIEAALKKGTVENFAEGYQDYLQAPLQPLMDNLASATYQTFEQDPVKYRNYEEAVCRALEEWPREDLIIIYVVGAGRGPLVARCLSAIGRSGKDAFIYAVEKNPNAFVTLQQRKDQEWGDKVNLLFGDMRTIAVPEKADIIVSELLGSFGDNELSPECLDGAMRFLKADGISIPSSYTAHLAPLSSSKLYNEARASKDPKSMETPYVVMFQAVNVLSGERDPSTGFSGNCGPQIQECWEFEHPRKDVVLDEAGLPLSNSHNTRSAKLNFHIPHAGVLHGMAGYFEAVLYGNIGLSIHPHRKNEISKDMLSWFPLFFPFKEPLYLPSNSELHVSIWRLTNQRQVWYEWHAESFLTVFNDPSLRNDAIPRSPTRARASSSSSMNAPSPYIDAVDLTDRTVWRMDQKPTRFVKIGQTSLHNAGGRSSYIGL
ncbi:PRMT5-domain-containing protein [Mycena floridula]|nr:PRMT5-domain-containing protein [Mycena floridula]